MVKSLEERPLSFEELVADKGQLVAEDLLLGLRDGRAMVRANAALGLAALGHTGPDLIPFLRDSHPVAAHAAGEAIGHLGLAQRAHLVAIGGLANKSAVDKKIAELGRFGVTDQVTVELEGGGHEIVLGAFATEAEARDFLQGLVKRGIKSARVDSRQLPPPKARIEARGPASELLRQLPQLIAPYADATIGDCPS